ncbi:MAG: AAA family ATPase [bacterium]
MYLQRIELSGFKSFAQKTILEFPAPDDKRLKNDSNKNNGTRGITAIVGPNGSGKSNVVDAVRWVLGEQSLKLLRGKKSTDVIFAGSEKKAQMSMAEVSLYLNNEDGQAPIDYTEIVITRRIYRDGNSEYLLNKNEVRLFDIVMLLAKTNFGQNTYSVIGQGMIDRIVNYSSQDRKAFFDDATGVKQFQIKRDRSVSKLKKSRENVTQVKALIKELEPHLKMLTTQVNRLHKRLEIEHDLRELQVTYYARLWTELDVTYKKLVINFTQQDKQRLKLESEIGSLQEKLEKLSLGNSRVEEFDNLQQEYNRLMAQKNDLLQEQAIIRGKLDLEYAKVGKQNLSWLENKKVELDAKVASNQEALRNQKMKLDLKRKELADAEKIINGINDELTVLQNNFQFLQEEIYSNRGENRSSYLLDSVRAVLDLKNQLTGIYGTVSDIGKVDRRYEGALSTAAGNRLLAIVVDNDETAVQCIKFLKDNRLASMTFFPLNKLREYAADYSPVAGQGVIGLAIDLVDFDPKFVKVFQQIFGDTLVVETVEDARSFGIGNRRMVTLEGDSFEKSGVVKGGYQKKEFLVWQKVSDNKFSQAEKIKEAGQLKINIEQKYRHKDEMLNRINNIRFEIRSEEERARVMAQEVSDWQGEKARLEVDIKEAQLSPEERTEYLNELKKQQAEKEKKLNSLAETTQVAKQKVDQFNLEEERKKQEIFATQQAMHEQQIKLNEAIFLLNDVRVELAKVETRKDDLFNSIKQDLGEDYRPKAVENTEEIDMVEMEAKISRFKKQLELIGGTDPSVEQEYKDTKDRFDFLSQQSEDLEKAIIDLEKIVVELDKLIKDQFETEFKRINKDFSDYFKQLFDGGSAKLVLTQKELTEAEQAREEAAEAIVSASEKNVGEEVAEADKPEREEPKEEDNVEDNLFLANMGIDIEACPPGKKIKNIAVLSGGEKTMTALALICAIISNNPSPFVLFDEVDAALDEVNSSKFGNIIQELAHKTQFIVITHNRAIMAKGDVLYGVTMQGDGISRLISLKLEEAEKIAKQA